MKRLSRKANSPEPHLAKIHNFPNQSNYTCYPITTPAHRQAEPFHHQLDEVLLALTCTMLNNITSVSSCQDSFCWCAFRACAAWLTLLVEPGGLRNATHVANKSTGQVVCRSGRSSLSALGSQSESHGCQRQQEKGA